jgi:putative hemolysin
VKRLFYDIIAPHIEKGYIMLITNNFTVEFVKSGKLLEEAQVLRRKIFFHDTGKDEDAFDKFCQHLVVIERDSQRIVGTYRLLLGSIAKKNIGFYSETEFDLTNIKRHCKGELLELGRSCVEPAYRKHPILPLMWRAIILFIEERKVEYIFGCASVDEPSAEKIGKIFSFFKENCFSPSRFRIQPLNGKTYPYEPQVKSVTVREISESLPALIKGYLKMGAQVCGEPVWDKEFNTADFFMLLETQKINASYKKKLL